MAHLKTSNWIFIYIVFGTYFYCNSLQAQKLEQSWVHQTKGKIVAGPIMDSNLVFIGSEKGDITAININTGQKVWDLDTDGNIQAKAVVNNDIVYFESANKYYAVNKDNGDEVWTYSLNMPPEKFTFRDVDFNYKLDFFDDKRSSGVINDSVIYYGTSNGKIIGLDIENGALQFSFSTENSAPVRSTPYINNDKLFFGDWNGIIYCYDLNSRNLLWKKHTYREKPYDTFGGIASEFQAYNGMLFYGARNPMFNVLWIEDGNKEWTYTDPDGGWLIGDPVIFNDTLYIGGSDNFSMLAFNPNDGKLLWKQKGEKNIYTKPIVTEDWVIYTTGNSYNPKDAGELILLDRFSGEVLSKLDVPSGSFSSPVLSKGNVILFGSNQGNLYAINIIDN